MSLLVKRNREIFEFVSSELNRANSSIKIAVAWFTDPELLKVVSDKKIRDSVKVELIIYDHEINAMLDIGQQLRESVLYSNLPNDAVMHHKFVIIDEQVLITGSYNWTIKARRFNRENILFTTENAIVTEYVKEFENLKKNSVSDSRHKISKSLIEAVEDKTLFYLEQDFNKEIYDKLERAAKLNIGIDINLAYGLVDKHTPVIAAKNLASAENGEYIQSGLLKLQRAKRLDLSFEESIINNKYRQLFSKKTVEDADKKLRRLDYFKDSVYQNFWYRYTAI